MFMLMATTVIIWIINFKVEISGFTRVVGGGGPPGWYPRPSTGVTPKKKNFVGKFTKTSGQTRSNGVKKVRSDILQGVTPERNQ